MSDFHRYAVYYLPDDAGLAAFGASWLGWDVVRGLACPHPEDVPGIGAITATPRKYGFHATLKPPFRLQDGQRAQALHEALASLAGRSAPVRLDGLTLARLGRFLALVPDGDTAALNDLAFACVRDLDSFRRPPEADELARRRKAGLTPPQEALLLRWGYPYVGPEFRFHLTLSGSLDPTSLDSAASAAAAHLPPLPRPFDIASLALVGEDDAGMFHLVHRYALTE